MLRTPATRDQFDALRRLSFVSPLQNGLVLHGMRDTIAYRLTQRDPGRHITYRLRAWRYLNDVSHRSARTNLWQYTADLLYLVQNPNVRNAFFRPGAIEVSIEPALSGDRTAIEAICAKWEPHASADWLLRWFECHPETFLVGRTISERVAGFYIIFEHDRVDSALLRSDPITAAWQAHLDANPVLSHERVLFCRRWLSLRTVRRQDPFRLHSGWTSSACTGATTKPAADLLPRHRPRGVRGHRGATWFCSYRARTRATW